MRDKQYFWILNDYRTKIFWFISFGQAFDVGFTVNEAEWLTHTVKWSKSEKGGGGWQDVEIISVEHGWHTREREREVRRESESLAKPIKKKGKMGIVYGVVVECT